MLILKRPWTRQPNVAVKMTAKFGIPLFGFLPTQQRGVDMVGRCPVAQDTSDRVPTANGIGATFSSGKWIQYDASPTASSTLDTIPTTRVYIVEYGAQGYQWLSHSSATGSAYIMGHGASPANMYCQATANEVVTGSVAGKYYVIIIRANVYGATSSSVVNGVQVDTWTNSDARAGTTTYIGRRSASDGEWFTGKLLGHYIVNGICSDAASAEICRNPWQVFGDRRTYIPTAAAAAASTYTLSSPTYGVLTSSTVTPRVTVTVA